MWLLPKVQKCDYAATARQPWCQTSPISLKRSNLLPRCGTTITMRIMWKPSGLLAGSEQVEDGMLLLGRTKGQDKRGGAKIFFRGRPATQETRTWPARRCLQKKTQLCHCKSFSLPELQKHQRRQNHRLFQAHACTR